MQHTVAAVFDQHAQAQSALEDLVAAGVSRSDIQLSQKPGAESGTASGTAHDEAVREGVEGESFGDSVRHFFSNLFGTADANEAEIYSEAVHRGSYVLTVTVPDDAQLDTVTRTLDSHDPVNIDERTSQWKSGGWAARPSMRQDGWRQDDMTQSQGGYGQGASAGSQSMQGAQGGQSGASLQRAQSGSALQGGQGASEQHAIPVVREELQVGKREVQRGGVRVFQRVKETPVNEEVSLREEHVNVERRPVDQPASSADLNRMRDQSFELRETAEEPVVQKSARVVEEVVIGKEVTQRTENISDTVRSSEVEVEQLNGNVGGGRGLGSAGLGSSGRDDGLRSGLDANVMESGMRSGWRSHWDSLYADRVGENYEDYEPMYKYGAGLRSDGRFSNRTWEDSENEIRTDWENRYPGSTWERFKASVRHGWDKVTS